MVSHEYVVPLKECNHSDKDSSTNRGKQEKKKKSSFDDANLGFWGSSRSLWQRSENILVYVCVCVNETESLCLPPFFYEFMAMTLEQKYRDSLLEHCLRQHD